MSIVPPIIESLSTSSENTKEEKKEEIKRLNGSEILLQKLPLLSRALALSSINPTDPNAECNLLSYGSDFYRIYSLNSTSNNNKEELKDQEIMINKTNRHNLERKRTRKEEELKEKEDNDNEENDEEEKEEISLEGKVTLPTRMPFITMLEAKFYNSLESPNKEIIKKKKEEEQEEQNKKTKKEIKEEKSTENLSRKDSPTYSVDVNNSENKNNNKAHEGKLKGNSYNREEITILSAIREPLIITDNRVKSGQLNLQKSIELDLNSSNPNNNNNNNNSNIKNNGIGNKIHWERMLENIINRDNSNDNIDDSIRTYLRRVAWIEQQKKIQLNYTEAAETQNKKQENQNQQSWLSMSEAMRVQKEMQRMRVQRKRFRRTPKEE